MRVRFLALGLICACASPNEGLTPGELSDAGTPSVADAAVPDAELFVPDPAEPAIITGHPFHYGFDTAGNARAVLIEGALAYVADSEAGVAIIDIGDPKKPSLRATLDTEGSAQAVDKAGDLLFIADNNALVIADVSDPSAPRSLSRVLIGGFVTEIAVRGGLAYVSGPAAGFTVVDYSNPLAPNIRANIRNSSSAIEVIGGVAHAGGDVLDVSNPDNVTVLGALGLDSADLAVGGDLVYLTLGSWGLAISDVSDPLAPKIVGRVESTAIMEAVSISDGLVYVAGTRLEVFDASVPSFPVLRARYELGLIRAHEMVIKDGLAFLAAGVAGLQIFDLSNPGVPAATSEFPANGVPNDVALAGDIAYVAAREGGLLVYDVSAPEATLLTAIDTPGWAFEVLVDGDRLYLADGESGVLIFDLTTPAAPVLKTTFNTPGLAQGLARSGDLLFVADRLAGMQVIDVSNPDAPVFRSNVPALIGFAVAAAGARVILADPNGLRIFDVSDPDAPLLLGTFESADQEYSLFAAGDTIYLAGLASGLKVIDVSNPSAPIQRGSLDTLVYGQDLQLVQSVLYVATARWGLELVDVSDLDLPVHLDTIQTSPTANTIAAGSGRAVLGGDFGLMIFDVSFPANPIAEGGARTPNGGIADLAVRGELAYLACGAGGVQIVDISDPRALFTRGRMPATGGASGIVEEDGLVYLANGGGGLEIIDVADPDAPMSVGTLETPGTAMNVVLTGDRAFVADWGGGVQAIDIARPAAPVLMASFEPELDGRVHDLAIAGDTAYVATPSGFQIIGVADVSATVNRGRFDAPRAGEREEPGTVSELVVDGPLVYVAGGYPGLHVVDVSNPLEPELRATYATGDNTTGVVRAVSTLYVAAGKAGLQLIDISDPDRPRARAVFDAGDAKKVTLDGGTAYVIDNFFRLKVIDLAPRLLADTITGATPGETVRFGLSWIDDYPGFDEQFTCVTGGGTCRIIEIDQDAHTATLEWVMPSERGDYEVAIAAGNYHYYWIERRQISVR